MSSFHFSDNTPQKARESFEAYTMTDSTLVFEEFAISAGNSPRRVYMRDQSIFEDG